MVRPRVFMDFAVDSEPYGRVVFELLNDSAPKTCENFRSLCTGERGMSASGNSLYYENSIIHRSIKDFMIQGGDFSKRNGTGGESIFGGTFADEDLQRPLNSPALLCMANKGPNTNGSQFFVTLRECPHLTGKHVVFGRVIRGFEDVVERLADVPVDEKDRPTKPIVVANCGELELKKRRGSDAVPSNARKSKKSRSHRDRTPGNRNKREKRGHSEQKSEDSIESSERKETEEEYDARLEREEKEWLKRERKRALVRIKETRETYQDSTQSGVRYKGRGRMKYVDPEHQYRS
ncbi:Peptidyl-prolyl cis-trans isomerase cyp11 [Leucoagaricus sp. SymC.cos]|nr:Peptidyl-prolyl cis-trans isomerase cyp11 [Leucoagaricus sp. SymC.cos]